jgi:hypothetical protein
MRPPPLEWVHLHESRRHTGSDLVVPTARPPAHDLPRAAIDAATWSGSARTASGLLVATVQQGLTSVPALFAELESAGRVRHRRLLRATLLDIAGGADALSEIDGVGHLEPTRWYDDLMRDAELARVELAAIRFRRPALALRAEPDRVVTILRSVLLA